MYCRVLVFVAAYSAAAHLLVGAYVVVGEILLAEEYVHSEPEDAEPHQNKAEEKNGHWMNSVLMGS